MKRARCPGQREYAQGNAIAELRALQPFIVPSSIRYVCGYVHRTLATRALFVMTLRSREEVSTYLEKHDVQTHMQQALQHIVNELAPEPLLFLSKFFAAKHAETVKAKPHAAVAEDYTLDDKILGEGIWGTVYKGSRLNAAGELEQVAIKKLDKKQKDKEGKMIEKQDASTQLVEMEKECRLNQFAHELSKTARSSWGCALVPRMHA